MDRVWHPRGVSTARLERVYEAPYWYGNGKIGDRSLPGPAQIGRGHGSLGAVPERVPHVLLVDVVLSPPS